MYGNLKKCVKLLIVLLIMTSNYSLAAKQAVITASTLNVREKASATSKIVEKVSKDEKYIVLEETNDWVKISKNSIEGYISCSYVKLLEIADSSTTKTIRFVNAASLNVRNGDSVEAKVLATLKNNDEVEVLEIKTEWVKVKTGNIEGWVSRQYLKANKETAAVADQSKYVSITTASLNVRKLPNANSDKIGTLTKGKTVKVLSKEDLWYKIEFENSIGYIVAEYTSESTSTASRGEYDRSDITIGSILAEKALKYLGHRYVYGGESPSGFDCSGLVYYVYKDYVKNLPRSATPQSKIGEFVAKSSLKKGDLVFFGEDGGSKITHVGIYLESGMFVHAANPSRGVVKDTLFSGYYNTNYLTARRVVD